MRSLALAAALSLVAAPALAQSAQGDWLLPGGGVKIRISPCAGAAEKLCGLISWMREPNDRAGAPKRDVNNPDPKLRGRPIVGMAMIRDFKAAGAGRWTGGKIYDPESGKTYDSKLSLNPNGSLKVEGCVLVVCRGMTWTRAS